MDASIVHTMHDEIIVEARVEIAEKVADILKESMVTDSQNWCHLFE